MPDVDCQLFRSSTNGITIIFIHGILGDKLSWYNSETQAYWPRLVYEDQRLTEYGLYVFNYRADAFSGSYSIEDAAGKLAEHISDQFSDQKGLVFVGHSMGGIVARTYVVNNLVTFHKHGQKIGVFLVASPSAGSLYANLIAQVSPYYNSQLRTLRSGQTNEWLSSVDRRFLNAYHDGDVEIVGKELIEDSAPKFWRHLLQCAQIVPPVSAAKYFPRPLRIDFSDHSSIAKPANSSADQHKALCRFLRDFSGTTNETEPSSSHRQTAPAARVPCSDSRNVEAGRWPATPQRRSAATTSMLGAAIAAGLIALIAIFWPYIYYPTVDLTRDIDFTRLTCGGNGNKSDVVTIDDTYDVILNLFGFKSYSKLIEFSSAEFSAEMYDLNVSSDVPVPGTPSPYSDSRSRNHGLTIANGQMRARWVWHNAHGTDQEGNGVTGGWNLRNLTINYKLPTGKTVKNIVGIVPYIAAKQCAVHPNSIVCLNLYTREKVQITWKWDVWQGCKN